MWKLEGLEMPAWFNPFSPQSSSPAPLEGVQTPSKDATPNKEASRSHQSPGSYQSQEKCLSVGASVPAARAAAGEKTKTPEAPRRFQLL
jgi:hypothetical protein